VWRRAGKQAAFPCRCPLGLSKVADSPARIRELVRMEHAFGGDWIKTMIVTRIHRHQTFDRFES